MLSYQITMVCLFGLALGALVAATMLAVRASSGLPGDEVLLAPEDLKRWTEGEVRAAPRCIRRAQLVTVAGAVAAGLSWAAPSRPAKAELMTVHTNSGQYCGRLSQFAPGALKISSADGYYLLPIDAAVQVEPVAARR